MKMTQEQFEKRYEGKGWTPSPKNAMNVDINRVYRDLISAAMDADAYRVYKYLICNDEAFREFAHKEDLNTNNRYRFHNDMLVFANFYNNPPFNVCNLDLDYVSKVIDLAKEFFKNSDNEILAIKLQPTTKSTSNYEFSNDDFFADL